MAENDRVRQRLTDEELQEFKAKKLEPGTPYVWVMSFGWAIVGFYVCHETPLRIRVAYANFFRNAHADYGQLAQQGPGEGCEWRFIGNSLVNDPHVLRCDEYFGDVPKARIG